MNEEADKKNIVSGNITIPAPLKNPNGTPFSVFAVIIAAIAIIVIGGLYFYSSSSKLGSNLLFRARTKNNPVFPTI